MSRRPIRLVQETLLEAAAANAGKVALIAGGGRSLSYGEFLKAASRLARAFQDLGLRRGDRVAIFMENGWRAAAAIYATWLAGGVILVLNPQTKDDKLGFVLRDSDATLLIADERLAPVFRPAVASCSQPPTPVVAGSNETAETSWISFDAIIDTPLPAPADPGSLAVDIAALIYTSGSTGHPKGVMMTHQSMCFTIGSLTEYLRLDAGDRILDFLPLAFDYGLYQLLMSIALGSTLILEQSFAYPVRIVSRAIEEGATVFPGVPTVFATLLGLARNSDMSMPAVTRVTNTAAALPADWIPALKTVFPNALIYRMYGLTECKRVSYLPPEELERRPNSVGRAIPGTEAFVLGPDGRQAPPGTPGILHVRGPHIMLGYWRQPELTRQMIKDGAWIGDRVLCTQDLFTADDDGYLYFVGRTDEIIKTRGEKVSPVEVENVLYAIPGVREAAIVGIPDPVLGEAVCAILALTAGSHLTERDVKKFCLGRLESFMVPQRVVFVEELPKTSTGKISKRGLREMAVAEEPAPVTGDAE